MKITLKVGLHLKDDSRHREFVVRKVGGKEMSLVAMWPKELHRTMNNLIHLPYGTVLENVKTGERVEL